MRCISEMFWSLALNARTYYDVAARAYVDGMSVIPAYTPSRHDLRHEFVRFLADPGGEIHEDGKRRATRTYAPPSAT